MSQSIKYKFEIVLPDGLSEDRLANYFRTQKDFRDYEILIESVGNLRTSAIIPGSIFTFVVSETDAFSNEIWGRIGKCFENNEKNLTLIIIKSAQLSLDERNEIYNYLVENAKDKYGSVPEILYVSSEVTEDMNTLNEEYSKLTEHYQKLMSIRDSALDSVSVAIKKSEHVLSKESSSRVDDVTKGFEVSAQNLALKYIEDYGDIVDTYMTSFSEIKQSEVMLKKFDMNESFIVWFNEHCDKLKKKTKDHINKFNNDLKEDAQLAFDKVDYYQKKDGLSTNKEIFKSRDNQQKALERMSAGSPDLGFKEYDEIGEKYNLAFTKKYEEGRRRKWLYFWGPLACILVVVLAFQLIGMVTSLGSSNEPAVLGNVMGVELSEDHLDIAMSVLGKAADVGAKSLGAGSIAILVAIYAIPLAIMSYIYYKFCKIAARKWTKRKFNYTANQMINEIEKLKNVAMKTVDNNINARVMHHAEELRCYFNGIDKERVS